VVVKEENLQKNVLCLLEVNYLKVLKLKKKKKLIILF